MWRTALIMPALMLTRCGNLGTRKDQLWQEQEGDPKFAWSKWIFKLDKIEAVRGRNLGDLNMRLSTARNQFMMDCMSSMNAALLPGYLDDLVNYAKLPTNRQPNEIS